MRCHSAAAGIAIVAAAVLLPAAPANAQHVGACPDTFSASTLAGFLALPQHVAGLTAGAYDVASLTALFALVDGNADGVVCVRPFPGGSKAAYHVNLVDNHAAD